VTSSVPVMEAVNPMMAVAHARRTKGRVVKWKAKLSESCPLRALKDSVKEYLYSRYSDDLYEYFEVRGTTDCGGEALIKSNVMPEYQVANGTRSRMLTCIRSDELRDIVDDIIDISDEDIVEVPRPT
jgi:hypothetical protein